MKPSFLLKQHGILADEKIVGWFNGRMEFGPTLIGHTQHSRRPALSRDADDNERQDQI